MSSLFRTDTRTAHITVREGLQNELTTRFDAPPRMTIDEYRALAPSRRRTFDELRARYTTGGIMVDNPTAVEALILYRRILRGNLYAPNRTGLMLDGAGHMGKTTLARHLMQWTFDKYVADFPEWENDGAIPVVYVEAPPRSTGKSLLSAFAHFLGLTVPTRYKTDDIMNLVINGLQRAGTQMVVIDEFHNIAAKNPGNGDSVDYIKELHNAVKATFIISGIHVLKSPILAGPRGDQLASRFIRQELTPYSIATDELKLRWQQLLLSFERQLPLFGQKPKTILAHADELHIATKGSIGSLAKLLTRTAVNLIWDVDPELEYFGAGTFTAQRRDITSEAVSPRMAA
jgi:hypothetical protein